MGTSRLNFCFLSGLPRTGSSALSAILSQNPNIYAGPNSPICQLMWDTQVSCTSAAAEQLAATNRPDFQDELVGGIPKKFYDHVLASVVVDKCRSWTLPDNMAMIRRYITSQPRVVVMTRPIDDIVTSFIDIYRKNGFDVTESKLLADGSEPIMRAYQGVEWARLSNEGEFLFVEYADLVEAPTDTLNSIYEFCEWEPFVHDFNNIVCAYPENDSYTGIFGLHDVRPKLGYRVAQPV